MFDDLRLYKLGGVFCFRSLLLLLLLLSFYHSHRRSLTSKPFITCHSHPYRYMTAVGPLHHPLPEHLQRLHMYALQAQPVQVTTGSSSTAPRDAHAATMSR